MYNEPCICVCMYVRTCMCVHGSIGLKRHMYTYTENERLGTKMSTISFLPSGHEPEFSPLCYSYSGIRKCGRCFGGISIESCLGRGKALSGGGNEEVHGKDLQSSVHQ